MKNPSRIRASILMIAFTFFSLSLVGGVQAKSPTTLKYGWTKTIGLIHDNNNKYERTEYDFVKSATDSNGHMYFLGRYGGVGATYSVDFDPTIAGVDNHPSYHGSLFLSKYKSDGTYLWTRTVLSSFSNDISGSIDPSDIVIDSKDNIYIGESDHSHSGTAYFGRYTENTIVVIKYNSKGDRLWTKKFAAGSSSDITGMSLDKNDNLYLTGSFIGKNVDFNSGTGSDMYTTDNGTWKSKILVGDYRRQKYADTFITKYNADGSYGWTKVIKSSSTFGSYPISIAYDDSGIFITGRFRGSVDFNSGINTDMFAAKGDGDIFIIKYDTSGNYLWTRTITGTGLNSPNKLVVNGKTITLLATIEGEVEFSKSKSTLNSGGTQGLLLSSYDINGNYLWSSTLTGLSGNNMVVDSQSNLLIGGVFKGKDVDFDPTSGVANYTSEGKFNNMFLSKYSEDGKYIWTLPYPKLNQTVVFTTLSIDKSDDIILGGIFYGKGLDFNPFAGTDIFQSSGYRVGLTIRDGFQYVDIFFTKLDNTKPKVVKEVVKMIKKTTKHINAKTANRANAQNVNKQNVTQNTSQNTSSSGTFAKVGLAAVGIVALLSMGGVVFMKMRKS